MPEQGNIQYNIKGEKPLKGYQIVRVRNVANAKEVLENFKNAVLTILKNKNLSDEDPKWEKLLPQGIVNKLKQLDSDDRSYDELLKSVNMSVYKFQKIKEWEWYSSLETENGFDIIVKGKFNAGQFISFIHCQNVPLDNIRIIDADKQEIYELKTIKDYTSYKILK
ncbi:hypothetical protein KRE40_07805 [Elizabethkingia meningoseptica]|uniref:hypothetical protein n=1 Tax=Elizabethkingia meningoseptica TaxID=238 RepID=UPI00099AD0D1|nr:hypothetical protein [Elizabethkingia meningoseptica]MDE5438010.1 hypothetical protein [Elizabethkingia meningoseptica]MDE5508553.1 hypothetical protein [Elizabethkingia meningoseptica]MDE5516087.1 hypothetical protein [Elizabethkingia meningoseptica]MDE5526936.1 hypothetical protein [Elizabethkingia meningoseptica]MDE5531775.1 hypothetical protein [Elizabethkingia meningoseptica]